MGSFWRNLETIAGFYLASWLTLHRQFKLAFQDIRRLDAWMSVPRNRCARFYFHLHVYSYVTRHRTVHLRKNRPLDA
jgi:hypothetical protein